MKRIDAILRAVCAPSSYELEHRNGRARRVLCRICRCRACFGDCYETGMVNAVLEVASPAVPGDECFRVVVRTRAANIEWPT